MSNARHVEENMELAKIETVSTKNINSFSLSKINKVMSIGQRTTDDAEITSYARVLGFLRARTQPAFNPDSAFCGTSLGILLLVWLFGRGVWYYFPLCFVIGYAFAWTSHFFVENNKPATFKYPLWSFISDYKMMWFMMTGRMESEVERAANK